MSRAQRILAGIVGVITAVLLLESYGAMVTAARAGGRAIPALWPLGTEALALAMEVSVLEAKRLHHTAVLRLSWVLLVASVALSTVLQVAVAPPLLVGYVTAGATPTWLLGSFAVLSLLYRTQLPADTSQGRTRPASTRRPASSPASASGPGAPTTPWSPRPPSPTRPPPAATRPRPCAPSTACSTDEPTVTPRPDQPRAGRVPLGSSPPPPVPSATDRHPRSPP